MTFEFFSPTVAVVVLQSGFSSWFLAAGYDPEGSPIKGRNAFHSQTLTIATGGTILSLLFSGIATALAAVIRIWIPVGVWHVFTSSLLGNLSTIPAAYIAYISCVTWGDTSFSYKSKMAERLVVVIPFTCGVVLSYGAALALGAGLVGYILAGLLVAVILLFLIGIYSA